MCVCVYTCGTRRRLHEYSNYRRFGLHMSYPSFRSPVLILFPSTYLLPLSPDTSLCFSKLSSRATPMVNAPRIMPVRILYHRRSLYPVNHSRKSFAAQHRSTDYPPLHFLRNSTRRRYTLARGARRKEDRCVLIIRIYLTPPRFITIRGLRTLAIKKNTPEFRRRKSHVRRALVTFVFYMFFLFSFVLMRRTRINGGQYSGSARFTR